MGDLLCVLSTILETGWKGPLLVTSEHPESEKMDLCSVVRIIKKLQHDTEVIIGVTCPTAEIADIFKHAGANEIRAVSLRYTSASKGFIRGELAVKLNVCPALQLKKEDPAELSVCGKRNGRLILVMRHYREWCLSDFQSCPYWLGTFDEN
ncbi:MAG: hypothetical protein ACLFQB_06345 [Chitinispirillaceae bacterium]